MIENPQEAKVDQYKDNSGKKITHLVIGAVLGVGMLLGESFIVGLFAAKIQTPLLLYVLGIVAIAGNLVVVIMLMKSSLRFLGIGLLILFCLIILAFGGCLLLLQTMN